MFGRNAMKQLQPVIWSKGTLLTPQHLQVQDRFVEDTLAFRLQSLKFCPWGFSRLIIDQEALGAGRFAIAECSGILPDGLLFEIPHSDDAPPSRVLKELFSPGDRSLDFYLTLPEHRRIGVNVSHASDGGTRYLSERVAFQDETRGEDKAPQELLVARKNFRILSGNENPEGLSTLRAARIERDATGKFTLAEDFVPPVVSISASRYLGATLKGVLEVLTARSGELAGLRRQKNLSLADFTAADIANFWLLYTVNSHYPVFSHLYKNGASHPEELYSAMVSLAGSLSTFSPTVKPKDFPVYEHNDLGPAVAELNAKIRAMLETVVPTNVITLHLKQVRPSIYATPLEDEQYLAGKMYLALSADTSEDTVIRDVPVLVKVCSATHLDHLINNALPGVQLAHRQRPPAEIPVQLKHQYFRLNQSGAAWEAIVRARNFAAYVPDDFPNPKVELVIVMPEM